MEQKSKKNYIILVILLLGTIFLTLVLANVYKTKNRLVSNFYEYSNKIGSNEFEVYMTENSDTIIYISDKYDLSHESFENKFRSKIEELGLKEKLIFIDKSDVNADFLKTLRNDYSINIDLSKMPLLVVIIDNEVIKNVYVDENSNIDTFIDYGAFE